MCYFLVQNPISAQSLFCFVLFIAKACLPVRLAAAVLHNGTLVSMTTEHVNVKGISNLTHSLSQLTKPC